jgi:hypothetical protein
MSFRNQMTFSLASENPFKVHVTLAGATMTTRNALNVTHVEGFNGHLTILLHSLRTYLLTRSYTIDPRILDDSKVLYIQR